MTLVYSTGEDLTGRGEFSGTIGGGSFNITVTETGLTVSGLIGGGPVEETPVTGILSFAVSRPAVPSK